MDDFDRDKIDEVVLALMYLTVHDGNRAWKSFDWDSLDKLYEKDLIWNPVGKAKSVVITEEGLARSESLYWRYFGNHRKRNLLACYK